MPKKRYQVIKATTREIPGVLVGGRVRKFGRNGTFTVGDKGEADEINKVLGMKGKGDVVVVTNTEKEPGHNYTFQGIPLKPQKQKVVGDTLYIWKFGKWRKVKSALQKREHGAKARRYKNAKHI